MVRKIKRKPKAKIQEAPQPTQAPPAQGLGGALYHVPDAEAADLNAWAAGANYDAMEVVWTQADMPREQFVPSRRQYSVRVIDRRSQKTLDPYSVADRPDREAPFVLVRFNDTLTSGLMIQTDAPNDPQAQTLSWIQDQSEREDHCEVLVLSYQLKTQPVATTSIRWIDKDGFLQQNKPSGCQKPQVTGESTRVLDDDTVVNFAHSQSVQRNGDRNFVMNMVFSRRGHEFFPDDIPTFLIKKDFSDVIVMKPMFDATAGAVAGVQYAVPGIPVGNYYFMAGLAGIRGEDEAASWITAPIQIR